MSAYALTTLPKIVLHDHLDGGMRPVTLMELAAACGYSGLQTQDLASVAELMRAPNAGDLIGYLEAFAHPVAVLQSEHALELVAYQAVQDWADDGVVYGELRFAPELHTRSGLSFEQACRAVLRGMRQAPIPSRLVVTALRNNSASLDAARVAAQLRDEGVAGFDLAGPERGWPLGAHTAAIQLAKQAGLGITLHAGEETGPDAVTEALDLGADRIGHGVAAARDRDVMARLRDSNIMLEVCLTSNLQTGVSSSLSTHPLHTLAAAGVAMSIQVDNRTVSDVSATSELGLAVGQLGWTDREVALMTRASLASAFADEAVKQTISRVLDQFFSC